MNVAAAEQNLILMETGTLQDAEVKASIPAWWARYEGNALQSLYTKRDILEYLKGKYRTKLNIASGPDRVEAKALFDNVVRMSADVVNEIVRQENRSDRSGVGTVPVANDWTPVPQRQPELYINPWTGQSDPVDPSRPWDDEP